MRVSRTKKLMNKIDKINGLMADLYCAIQDFNLLEASHGNGFDKKYPKVKKSAKKRAKKNSK